MNLKWKLIFSYGAIVAILGLFSTITVISILSVQNHLRQIGASNVDEVFSAHLISDQLHQTDRLLQTFYQEFLQKNPGAETLLQQALEKAEVSIPTIFNRLKRATRISMELADNESKRVEELGELKLIAEIESDLAAFITFTKQEVHLYTAGENVTDIPLLHQQAYERLLQIQQTIYDLKSDALNEIENEVQFIQHKIDRLTTLAITMLALALTTTFFLGMGFTRRIASPIKALTAATSSVAQGNLELPSVDIRRKDEIGELAQAFVTMVTNLRSQTTSIAHLNREIMERRKAEKALRRSESRFRMVVESTDDLITKVDPKGRFLYANHSAERFIGSNPEAIVGQSAFDPVHHLDRKRTQAALKQWLRQHIERASIENRLVNQRSGRVYHMLWNCTIRYDQNGKPQDITSIAKDLTPLKQAEQALINTRKLEAVITMAGGVAHDYNNLLSVILGNVSILIMDVDPGHRFGTILADIETAAEKARRLTHKFLEFATPKPPDRRKSGITRVIDQLVIQTREAAPVEVVREIPEHLWSISMDTAQIGRALQQIIDNALEAMPEGGILKIAVENTTIQRPSRGHGIPIAGRDYVQLVISDTGMGIDQESQARIFDPYYSTKQRGMEKGMGFGLPLAQSIIKRHNGHISVRSRANKGTKVTIYLPAYRDAPSTKVRHPTSLAKIEIRRVLVMDDEPLICKMAQQMLERLGYEVGLVPHGDAAYNAVAEAITQKAPFDVVILDLTIESGMGGMAALEKIRAIAPRIKAIVASGYTSDPIMARPTDFGFDASLIKPYTITQLDNIL